MDPQTLLTDLEALAKSQKVRLFDMYFLGPFMAWYAFRSKGMGKWPRRALFSAGIYTVVYNLNNYRNIKQVLLERFQEQGKISDA